MAAKADRAKLFMPFAALKGYYELILEQEAAKEQRRELCDDEANVLSDRLKRIGKGRHVRIRYYNQRSYVSISGTIYKIDYIYRYLIADERKIWFDDIVELEEYIPEGRETWLT